MALKIRLRQHGRTNRTVYRLVVTDSRSPRDGKYVEELGWYNPIEADEAKQLEVKADRVQHWLNVGAQLTEKVVHLVRRAAPEVVKACQARQCAQRAKNAAKRKDKGSR